MHGNVQLRTPSWAERRDQLRRQRDLGEIDHVTLTRLVRVDNEALVASAKVYGLSATGRVGVTELDLLLMFSDACAGGDHFRSDANRLLTETVRLGIGEVLADLVDTYARESLRSDR